MDGNEYISLSQAAGLFPRQTGGKKISLDALRRRILKGVRGVRLKAIWDGRGWYTTREWVLEFQDACTRARLPDSAAARAAIDDEERRARETLKRLGIDLDKHKARQMQAREGAALRASHEAGAAR